MRPYLSAGVIMAVFGSGFVAQSGEQETYPGTADEIAAPVLYKGEAMLIISDAHGAAAVVFGNATDHGVKYQYRYVAKDGTSSSGNGELIEKYKETPIPGKPRQVQRSDEGSQLFIKAGSLKVLWSHGDKVGGYVYYRPEDINIQIAEAAEFKTIKLERFLRR